jgi:hypothetical protein
MNTVRVYDYSLPALDDVNQSPARLYTKYSEEDRNYRRFGGRPAESELGCFSEIVKHAHHSITDEHLVK